MCDSPSAIAIAKKLVYHNRTKHVEIDRNDRHFISEKIEGNVISLNYVPSRLQATGQHISNFIELSSILSLINIYRLVCGIVGDCRK